MNGSNYNTTTYHTEFGTFTFLSGEHLLREFVKGSHWEKDSIQKTIKILQKDWTVISVGTHVGCTIIPLSKYVDRIFCFEGQKLIYQLLLKNIYDNNVNNIVPFNAIMSTSYNTHASMTQVPSSAYTHKEGYNYGGVKIGTGDHKVRVYKMDDFEHLDRLDLIVLDAEGSEEYILHSGCNIITKYLPYIIMEMNDCKPTEEMKQTLNIDFEFNRVQFLQSLGYLGPFRLSNNDENYIFLPPFEKKQLILRNYKLETNPQFLKYKKSDITLDDIPNQINKLDNITYYRENTKIEISNDEAVCISNTGHIDKYKIYTVSDYVVLLIVNNNRVFIGEIVHDGIKWCNDTFWSVKPNDA